MKYHWIQMIEEATIRNKRVYASLIRRIMAIVYDMLLLLAILFIATAIANGLNHGEAIDSSHPYYAIYVIYIAAISFFYFGWFWTHSGQTLGMKTWQMKLVSKDLGPVSWSKAMIRTVTALVSWSCLGIGFIWSIFDTQKRTWHDIASQCVVLDLRGFN